jgi:hypothetical protein
MSLSQYFHEINSVAVQCGKLSFGPKILVWETEINNRVSIRGCEVIGAPEARLPLGTSLTITPFQHPFENSIIILSYLVVYTPSHDSRGIRVKLTGSRHVSPYELPLSSTNSSLDLLEAHVMKLLRAHRYPLSSSDSLSAYH